MNRCPFFVQKLAAVTLLTGLLQAPALLAQSSPASAKPSDDETLNLSPFEVNATTDNGYIATRASGATKTNTPMIELPHSIQVLNSEFIEDTASTSVYDAARYVSNVAGGDQRGDDAMLIRGFAATRLRNGQPYPTGNAFTFDEMDAFDRVEVIKGASAVLYGTSAPGGLINLVDKKPLQTQQSTVSLTAGSYDFYKAGFDTTGPLAKLGDIPVDYRIISSYEDSKSWREFVFRRRAYINGSLDFKISKDTDLLTRVEYQHDEMKDSYGKPYIWFDTNNVGYLLNLPDGFFRGDPNIDRKYDTHFYWDTELQHYFSQNWSVKGSLTYGNYYGSRTEVFISAQGPTISAFPRFAQYIPDAAVQWVGEVDLLGKFKVGPTSHQFLAGVNLYDRDENASNLRFNVAPDPFNIFAPVYGSTTIGTEVTSVRRITDTTTKWQGYFAQDQFNVFGDRLQFIVGVRKDVLDQKVYSKVTGVTSPNNDGQTSPRYGMLLRVTPQISLYASFNESFTPSSGAGSVQGVPFPSPTAQQKEIGAKFEWFDSRVTGGFSYFENVQRNLTVTDVLNPGFSIAVGKVQSKGMEFDAGFAITKNWQLIASAGVDRAIDAEDTTVANVGLRQANVPDDMASLWTKYDFKSGAAKGLSFGFGENYVGNRAGARDSAARPFTLPGYAITNGLISYKYGRQKFALNIENLFDKRYIMVGSARLADPGEHRALRFTYTLGV